MKINFDRLILHNFLSYSHSEIDLTKKGYCLVSGINNCSKDNTVSNGAGKSSWISAICWCLTGETIQGIKSNIKNIYIEEDLCYVTLEFCVDNNKYVITRYNKPKSDLKIIVNEEDKSGKGIKEGEVILSKYLNDIDKNLITSVILLGQGLPNKLSSHSPSGRKELLERLSKSDFMIEDIKSRILKRQIELNSKLKEYENELIGLNTSLTIYNSNKDDIESKLKLLLETDYTSVKNELINKVNKYSSELESYTNINNLNKNKLEEYTKNLDKIKTQQTTELEIELSNFKTKELELVETKTKIESDIQHLKKEIEKINNIQDVCPVCKRPFENVVKPDTTDLLNELNDLQLKYSVINEGLNKCRNTHNEYIQMINNDFKEDIEKETDNIKLIKKVIDENDNYIKELNDNLIEDKIKLSKIEATESSVNEQINNLKEELNKVKENIEIQSKKLDVTTNLKNDTTLHSETLKKIDNLVKRDFRGYLLSNVINYINNKMKEYCVDVFGSDDVEFTLDGNDIDISYCGKMFESLSGGEKQKIDLILQFSIRDMMSRYLNFSSNILCLDEIFDNLDYKSTTNVINMISNKLNDVESLFIISHHSDELQIPNDTELIIIKNEEGISEVN